MFACAHLPIHFTSSFDYLQYLIQCKCYVTSCWQICRWHVQVLLLGTFWDFFSFILLSLGLVESVDVEPEDITKTMRYLGIPYRICAKFVCWKLKTTDEKQRKLYINGEMCRVHRKLSTMKMSTLSKLICRCKCRSES